MMDKYAATGTDPACTAAPGDTTLIVFNPAALTRAKLYELIFSQGATPADNVVEWLVRRLTAVGTEGAGVVPAPLDSDAPVAQLDAGEAYTVEPTYTAATELLDFDLNQRATFRFVAAPGGEFWIPAAANEGIGMTPISGAYTGLTRVTAHWEE